MKKQLFSGASCGVLLALLVLVMSGCVTSGSAELATVQPRVVPQETVPVEVPGNASVMETFPARGQEQSPGDIILVPKEIKPQLAPMPAIVPKFPRGNGTITI